MIPQYDWQMLNKLIVEAKLHSPINNKTCIKMYLEKAKI
jgi:hypothetical protein